MILLVISGPPATGKTTITNILASELNWPVVSKDQIKERLFDERGIGNRTWSQQLGREAYTILEMTAKNLIKKRQPFILEGNFSGSTAELLHREAAQQGYKIASLRCDAPDDVIQQRITKRWESGRRHPGHIDNLILQEISTGRNWDLERQGITSDIVLQLDGNSALEENVVQAREFIKTHLG